MEGGVPLWCFVRFPATGGGKRYFSDTYVSPLTRSTDRVTGRHYVHAPRVGRDRGGAEVGQRAARHGTPHVLHTGRLRQSSRSTPCFC